MHLCGNNIDAHFASPKPSVSPGKPPATPPSIILSPKIIFSYDMCRTGLERTMFWLVSRDIVINLISMLFLTAYVMITQDPFHTILHLVLMFSQFVLNQRTKNAIQANVVVSPQKERMNAILSMIFFTLRIAVFWESRKFIIPTLLTWVIVANKLRNENLVWGTIPPLTAAAVFFGAAGWDAWLEWMAHGVTRRWIEILCEGWLMSSVLIMFTYYMATVTSFLKMKVHKLEETRKKLEEAMDARNTFMSHVSHEFRCPIMSSMGCLELLKETPLTESQNEMVDTIA